MIKFYTKFPLSLLMLIISVCFYVNAKAQSIYQICNGTSVSLYAQPGTAVDTALNSSYLWSTAETMLSIIVAPVINTTYTVTISGPSIGSISIQEFFVHVNPVPFVNLGIDKTICTKQSVTIQPSTSYMSYEWSTGETATSIYVTPSETSNYGVTVTDSNACTAIDDININVAYSSFTYSFFSLLDTNTLKILPYSNTSFTNLLWDFGDGNTSSENVLFHVYNNSGIYKVSLSVYDTLAKCLTTSEQIVSIGNTVNKCKASFEANIDVETQYVSFTSTSVGYSINKYNWNFGDGDTSAIPNPEHLFQTIDNYEVCLNIATATCKDMACKSIKTGNSLTMLSSEFNYVVDGQNKTVVLNETTEGVASSYSWDFGDNSVSTEQNPTHVYTMAGMYLVSLNVWDSLGQSSYQNHLLNVGANPGKIKGAFGVLMNKQVYAKGVIPLKFKGTVYSEESAVSWDFGDGTPVETTTLSPTHTYVQDGVYTVCMTVYNFDTFQEDTYCKEINVVTTSITSVDKSDVEDYKIYPNPATSLLTIEAAVTSSSFDYSIGTYRDVTEIQIKNTLGQLELITNQYSIDISSLQSGVYFIQIKTNNNIIVKKFIKE